MSGLDNIMNKAKEALKDEKTSDAILDKAADLAKSKFKGHEDKIDDFRQKADDALGDKSDAGRTSDTGGAQPDRPGQRPGQDAPEPQPTPGQDAPPRQESPSQPTGEESPAEPPAGAPSSPGGAPSSPGGAQNEPPAGFPVPGGQDPM